MTPSIPQENSNKAQNIFSTPSLPQNDSLGEQLERKALLLAAQEVYQYEKVSGLPMPMAGEKGVVLQVIELLDKTHWFKGQIENQLGIFINLEIWKILSQHQDTYADLNAFQSILAEIINSKEFRKLSEDIQIDKQNPLSALSELADRLIGMDAENQSEVDNIASYAKVFALYPTPAITGLWQDDKIFSAQRLAGLNPMSIELVTIDGNPGIAWSSIKQKLSPSITDDAIRFFLGKNATFESAINEKRLFVSDYQALKQVTADKQAPGAQKGNILMGPIALFVLTDDFPAPQIAAIQIDQEIPGQTKNNFATLTAADASKPGNANKWIMAKMFVQAADLNYNQAVNHLGETHLIEEAFALATYRQLAVMHPLNILLCHHFEALMVINGLGQLTLLNSDGLIQQILEGGLSGSLGLIQNAYKKWNFSDLDFPARITRRGLDMEALPYFPYRDDGQLIWDTIGEYVTEYLGLYYKSDSDVINDYELQSWAAEIASSDHGHVQGFKDSIKTIKELITITQRLVWTAGPQHAAVNFPQIDYAAFIPNLPAATYTKAPASFENTTVNEQDLLELLPPMEQTGVQVKTTYALAGFHFNSLLDYYDELDQHAGKVCKKYYDKLSGIVTTSIMQRNNERKAQQGLLPYTYFLPKNIPNSTSV